ncbi:MAG TPA: XRE family transcriptional regulator [Clostridiales bacterium]|nr:XRE family transcriptional regulator [Clostridiales bacterium]
MIHAYNEVYLSKAQRTLAAMMDCAVYDLNYEPDEFFTLFLQSGLGDEFGRGNPKFIAGKSGAELALDVIYQVSGQMMEVKSVPRYTRSPIYWAAWSLAYYQWFSGYCLAEIHQILPFVELLKMYPTLHEADISKFVTIVDEFMTASKNERETNLRQLRIYNGFSQKDLSVRSGVALRMIQLYEQKQNDINKAQAITLHCLAMALNCRIEDLLE